MSTSSKRPHLLYIMTDQQSATMLGCAGNPFVHTPAMDSLAANGCRFERTYCTNPVCLPSRVSMLTGQMPGRFGIRFNDNGGRGPIPEAFQRRGMGWSLREAGYETAYGGKTHFPAGMDHQSLGFETVLTKDQRDGLADACVEYLGRRHERPFLLVASFINPHDICFVGTARFKRETGLPFKHGNQGQASEMGAWAETPPEGMTREDFLGPDCPPLPSNFAPQASEPDGVPQPGPDSVNGFARERWSPEDWRVHRRAYARLTEHVDAQIGRVLEALRSQGLEENTAVIFASDHGEMDGAHGYLRKSRFFEEAVRVPFLVSWKGVTPPGRVERSALVSAGLDLIPTLRDFAGLPADRSLPGCSVRAWAEGREALSWREALYLECNHGRMALTGRHKYALYDSGIRRESLVDLEADPGETRNIADDPAQAATLAGLRKRLARLEEEHGCAAGASA